MAIKKFGKKLKDKYYQLRVGIYVLVFDKSKQNILLVSPPNGSYLLPGGEREKAETPIETIKRECIEELGYEVEVGDYLGTADEYYYSTHRKHYYYNPAYFYTASSWKEIGKPLEDFNTLRWASLLEARQLLKRESHQWAINRYLEMDIYKKS